MRRFFPWYVSRIMHPAVFTSNASGVEIRYYGSESEVFCVPAHKKVAVFERVCRCGAPYLLSFVAIHG